MKLLASFYPAREEGEDNTAGVLFIYLPVSSFEHHSKGSMSNQVFSAVLKIPHSLHCDGAADAGKPQNVALLFR